MVLATCWVVYLILRFAPGADAEMPSFFDWLRGALFGDFGESSKLRQGESVAAMIVDASAESVFIVTAAIIFAMLGAIVLTYFWSGRSSPHLSPASRAAAYVL